MCQRLRGPHFKCYLQTNEYFFHDLYSCIALKVPGQVPDAHNRTRPQPDDSARQGPQACRRNLFRSDGAWFDSGPRSIIRAPVSSHELLRLLDRQRLPEVWFHHLSSLAGSAKSPRPSIRLHCHTYLDTLLLSCGAWGSGSRSIRDHRASFLRSLFLCYNPASLEKPCPYVRTPRHSTLCGQQADSLANVAHSAHSKTECRHRPNK